MALPPTGPASAPGRTTEPVAKTGGGVIPAEWPAQAADLVVDTIDKVRDKTTKPLVLVARSLVYGLVIGTVAIVALILLLIVAVRVLDAYLPGEVWTVYTGFAVVFSAVGLILLSKANKPSPNA